MYATTTGTLWNAQGGYAVNIGTPGLYVGGSWGAASSYSFNTPVLENNAQYFFVSSDIYASARYEWRIAERVQIIGELNLALISGVNESDSWGFNQNQRALEKGEFSMQDASSSQEPFDLSNWTVMPLWEQFTCRTLIEARYDGRLAGAYQWEIHSVPIVSGYPTVIGTHRFIIKYYFLTI